LRYLRVDNGDTDDAAPPSRTGMATPHPPDVGGPASATSVPAPSVPEKSGPRSYLSPSVRPRKKGGRTMRSPVSEPPTQTNALDVDSPLVRRALATWPRLDRRALRRCGDDPQRIATVVSHRTRLPRRFVVRILEAPEIAPEITPEEVETWFG